MDLLDTYGSWAIQLFLTYQPVPFVPPSHQDWYPGAWGTHSPLFQLQQQGQRQRDSLDCHYENWSITLPGNSQKLLAAISSNWIVNFIKSQKEQIFGKLVSEMN